MCVQVLLLCGFVVGEFVDGGLIKAVAQFEGVMSAERGRCDLR